jgi:hypothetical protein
LAELALTLAALINGGALMDKVEYIPLEEAKSAKRTIKKSKVIEEVEAILKKLPQGQSGKIIAKSEKANTIKNRLVRVSRSLGMKNVTIKRVNDVVYFWRDTVT